jgi:hypothetical protein
MESRGLKIDQTVEHVSHLVDKPKRTYRQWSSPKKKGESPTNTTAEKVKSFPILTGLWMENMYF